MQAPLLKQVPLEALEDPLDAAGRLPTDADDLYDLAHSIERHGLLQPPGAVETEDHHYAVVFGRRRIRACALLGWTHIPCLIGVRADPAFLAAAWAENLDRADLSPIEQARFIARAIQTGLDTGELAVRLHKSRNWVEERANLLLLPDHFQQAVHARQITLAVAKALAAVRPDATRDWLFQQALTHGCTGAVARWWAATYSAPDAPVPQPGAPPPTPPPPERTARAEDLSPTLLTRACLLCQEQSPADAMAFLPVCTACLGRLKAAQADAGLQPPPR